MSTQHFNATEMIKKLQRKREIKKQRQCSQSSLKKHRAEIVALFAVTPMSRPAIEKFLGEFSH